jgi:hypothetical protein
MGRMSPASSSTVGTMFVTHVAPDEALTNQAGR